MEMSRTPIHLVRETTSFRKYLANTTFTTTSTETAGITKLKSAQERAVAKRIKETIRRAVPSQRVGLSMARGRRASRWVSPISFIRMLRKTFPTAWANMTGINTAIVFFSAVPPGAGASGTPPPFPQPGEGSIPKDCPWGGSFLLNDFSGHPSDSDERIKPFLLARSLKNSFPS